MREENVVMYEVCINRKNEMGVLQVKLRKFLFLRNMLQILVTQFVRETHQVEFQLGNWNVYYTLNL